MPGAAWSCLLRGGLVHSRVAKVKGAGWACSLRSVHPDNRLAAEIGTNRSQSASNRNVLCLSVVTAEVPGRLATCEHKRQLFAITLLACRGRTATEGAAIAEGAGAVAAAAAAAAWGAHRLHAVVAAHVSAGCAAQKHCLLRDRNASCRHSSFCSCPALDVLDVRQVVLRSSSIVSCVTAMHPAGTQASAAVLPWTCWTCDGLFSAAAGLRRSR